jgi:hypothetical protein
MSMLGGRPLKKQIEKKCSAKQVAGVTFVVESLESNWQADHVLAHRTGGKHAVDNYLPAYSLCNGTMRHRNCSGFLNSACGYATR